MRFYRAYDDAVSYVEQLVRDEQLYCDFRLCGKLKLASKASHFAGLRAAGRNLSAPRCYRLNPP